MWESAYCIGWVDDGREGSNCYRGRLLLDVSSFSCHLSFLEHLDTAYIS